MRPGPGRERRRSLDAPSRGRRARPAPARGVPGVDAQRWPWRATSSRRRAVTSPVRARDVGRLDAARPVDVDHELGRHPPGPAGQQHDPVGQARRLAHVVGDEQDRRAASRARCAPARRACTSRVIASSAPKGSSISSTSASWASARARATRWRMPPESWWGCLSMKPLEAHQLEELHDPCRALGSEARPAGGAASSTFLPTDSHGNRAASWNMRPARPLRTTVTGARLVEAGHEVEQGGLAAARRSDQADELACPDLERHPVEGEDGVVPVAEALGDGVQADPRVAVDRGEDPGLEDGRGHSSPTCGWPASASTSLSRVRS